MTLARSIAIVTRHRCLICLAAVELVCRLDQVAVFDRPGPDGQRRPHACPEALVAEFVERRALELLRRRVRARLRRMGAPIHPRINPTVEPGWAYEGIVNPEDSTG